MKTLHGYVPRAIAHLAPLGTLPPESRLNLAIGLQLSDSKGLDGFLQQLYDPNDPNYRQYLTPEQFAQKFGPTQAQYEQVVAFAQRFGLAVTARHGNRLLLDVNGSVAEIQRAFHITLRTYRHPTEPRDFFAPDSEPTVEAQLPILDVSGLNNFVLPHPNVHIQSPTGTTGATPKTGSGSGGTYMGNDFRAAYAPGLSLTGAGQQVGLLQFDGYYQADISAYEVAAGLPAIPLQTVLLDGYNGVPTTGPQSGNTEVSLDIEMAVSMAPGLAKIIVFEGGPNGLPNNVLSAMASSNQVKQLSCSWGWGGGPSATTDNIFKQMAAQGQSFFAASGDSDAFTPGQVDDPSQTDAPASCPFITVVGGTTLTTSGSGGAWASEKVWNAGGGAGSSGGISSYYSIPSWQTGIDMSSNSGSTTHRNIPDVALTADNIYVRYGNGTSTTVEGTSCATPLWAAFTALINQQAALGGRAAVGFVNPAVYALAKSASYTSAFHDVTAGNNAWSSSPTNFYAVSGYDLCTGWGTPAGKNLIDALAGPPDSLAVAPSSGFIASGPAGGPFIPVSAVLTLTNRSAASFGWSLSVPTWLSAAPTNGGLAPGTAAQITVELAPAAAALVAGNYNGNVAFTNQTSHAVQTVPFTLQVGQSIVQNGGFESGDFSGWTLIGNIVTGTTVYNAVETSSFSSIVHSGNYGAFLGDTLLATLSQNLATIPGQDYLVSFWVNNQTTGAGQQFLFNWNTNKLSTSNTIYSLLNPPVLPWTNPQFILTAASTNTVLQFAAENPPGGFGLDDVSVTPIPSLAIQTATVLPSGFRLGWRTTTGLVYQVQYTTNLLKASWSNLGPPISATSNSLTVVDSAAVGSPGPRFYRLMSAP